MDKNYLSTIKNSQHEIKGSEIWVWTDLSCIRWNIYNIETPNLLFGDQSFSLILKFKVYG